MIPFDRHYGSGSSNFQVLYSSKYSRSGLRFVLPKLRGCVFHCFTQFCHIGLFPRGGGTQKNFDRDARVTFLGLKFHNLLFLGLLKMRVIFWG